MHAPFPDRERQRLDALHSYAILDTTPEAAFDRITRLATRLLHVPVAMVTLVDESRQWFKSVHGITKAPQETPREISFCAQAILQDDVMVVPDAASDRRFADNILVTGAPHIRFYAGAPLKSSDGFNLGTLCALDTVPRQFTAAEQEILQDLAAIARDELELRRVGRERTQQSAAITNLGSGVVITEPGVPDHPIAFANPGFYEMTGYSPEEVIGRNCRFLQGPGTDPAMVDAIREAVAHQRGFHDVLLNYRKDGTPFWNELTISPVFDQNGAFISFVGLQSDVTERKRAADQLAENFEKLKQLEALRDDLTHMIIHDLRSPLTAVDGFLGLLEATTAGKLGPRELGFIGHARMGAAKLGEMVTSLLDVHRLEAGEMPVERRPHDLVEIVRQAAAPFVPISDGRLRLDGLPPEPVPVSCDAELIGRVVANLISNALKFTPSRGTVEIRVVPRGTAALVAIKDEGVGISPEFHGKIFERFGQVESRHERHSTGLGLAFCKLAVEAHGGTIRVESAPGKGSTFAFELVAA